MSLFFNKNNSKNATLCANMEKWSVGDHNTLYLIQYDYSCDEIDHIMEDIAKNHNATIIPINRLLIVAQYDYFIDDHDNIPEDFKAVAKEYLNDRYVRIMDTSSINSRDLRTFRVYTTRWAIEYAKKHSDKLFIIEDRFTELFGVYIKKRTNEPFILPSPKFSSNRWNAIYRQIDALRKEALQMNNTTPLQVF